MSKRELKSILIDTLKGWMTFKDEKMRKYYLDAVRRDGVELFFQIYDEEDVLYGAEFIDDLENEMWEIESRSACIA